MPKSKIAGVGRALPERVMTNVDLEGIVDTTDDWIVERTGIRERRILADGRCTSDLAAEAGRDACKSAGIRPEDLDAIIVGTVTPDSPMPATAVHVQRKLNAGRCPAFDISAACAGFLYGLSIADSMIHRGNCKKVLVIGVEILSRILDWTDRTTCVLFGDGAGAAVIVAADEPNRGIVDVQIYSDGAHAAHLDIPAGGSVEPTTHDTVEKRRHFVKMAGRQIYSQAVKNMTSACKDLLARNGLSAGDIDHVFAHQANMRILDSISQRIDVPMTRFFNNIERYGNTSSASIPISMTEAVAGNCLKSDDLLLLTALGAGLSWGAALIRW